MALSAAQAAYKRPPMGPMLSLWLTGIGMRVLSVSVGSSAAQMALLSTGEGVGSDIAGELARLHTDTHISVYTSASFVAQTLEAQFSLLRATSLTCDALTSLMWLMWLRPKSPRAASIMVALWAVSPLLVHTGTSPGPHAAFGMGTTLSFMALWPVWQQQRLSTGAQLWLFVSWALLVCIHPLGVLAMAAMVFVAIAWPEASAEARSTPVGQAGRLALNIGLPALAAGTMYLSMRLFGHIYPSAEVVDNAAQLSLTSTARTLSAAWGTDAQGAVGPWAMICPMPKLSAALLTAVFIMAGLSHAVGQKLIGIAALYGASLAAYHSVVQGFTGCTLVPAWLLLMAASALGFAQTKAKFVVRSGIACLVGWQLNVWLTACPSFHLPF